MTYKIDIQRGNITVHDTRRHRTYWMKNKEHVQMIVDLLNNKDKDKDASPPPPAPDARAREE